MKNALAAQVRCDHARWVTLAVAGVLVALATAPTPNAQPAGQQAVSPRPPAEETPAKAWRDTNSELCSMRFEGGTITALKRIWMDAFTNDNFVITQSAAEVRLPAFEIRHVRLKELARSIAFLSEGALTLEVGDQFPAPAGNIWRIGTPSPAEAPTIKMLAVPAPALFANKARLEALIESALQMEMERLHMAWNQVGQRGGHAEPKPRVIPLREQKVLVVVATENAIAGIESVIQAAEKAASPIVAAPPKTL